VFVGREEHLEGTLCLGKGTSIRLGKGARKEKGLRRERSRRSSTDHEDLRTDLLGGRNYVRGGGGGRSAGGKRLGTPGKKGLSDPAGMGAAFKVPNLWKPKKEKKKKKGGKRGVGRVKEKDSAGFPRGRGGDVHVVITTSLT